MEMERINDDTIRVLISSDDLSERGVTFLDLLDNHKEIENFFYSVLEEVDSDHQFANNEPVTFQVMPNRNGLELYISKNPGEAMEEMIRSVSKNDGPSEQDLDEVSDFLKKKLTGTDGQTDSKDVSNEDSKASSDEEDFKKYIIRLADFESLPNLAKLFEGNSGIETVLYQYQGDYYLEFTFYLSENTPELIKNLIAVANEYGKGTKISSSLLKEHGDTIIDGAALELARHYFK